MLYQLSYTPKPADREARMPLALSEIGRIRPGLGSIRHHRASQPLTQAETRESGSTSGDKRKNWPAADLVATGFSPIDALT